MDLPVTALLTAALAGMKWLAKNSQSKPDLGSDKSLAAELAEVLVSAVAGNRADAAAAGWLARMKADPDRAVKKRATGPRPTSSLDFKPVKALALSHCGAAGVWWRV